MIEDMTCSIKGCSGITQYSGVVEGERLGLCVHHYAALVSPAVHRNRECGSGWYQELEKERLQKIARQS
jgi:hypothetical protein